MRTILIHNNLFILFLFLLLVPVRLHSQELPEYDEIPVFLEIPGVGGGEIDALIKAEELYLPVTDLFDFLKIKNTSSPGMESISGFFVSPDAKYVIDRTKNLIQYQDKTFGLGNGDIIRNESNLYLKSSYFGKIFGLDCVFSFRTLSVTVTSKSELPLIREMKQEEMRKNISRLKGVIKADTNIARTYPLFKFGMADWSVTSSQEINGSSDTRLSLALGSMIAGGEATASLYYYTTEGFSEKQQNYLWRYVNNDFAPLRQVIAGKIQAGAISSLYNPVIGIQLTNTPTTFRRSFGTYTLSDKTEPGWTVELYVNNVLVDYTKADASGFFTFEVPLVYGNSLVKLKFFGPWGEERTREQNIDIPYNFLPKKTFEYTASAGIVEDTLFSRFSRVGVSYGATNNLTFGTGTEYLSSISSRPLMPFLNASYRLTNNLMVSGEYDYGVRAKGSLSYRLPSNMQLDLNYTWYEKDQKAIFYNYREERKATLSIPVKIGKFSTYQRFSVNQIVLPASKYTTGEWLISGSLFGINTNLTTYALLIDKINPYFYSTLSMSFRLPGGFIFMPQAQYGYTENKLFSAKARIEKQVLSHGFVSLAYEQNFKNNLKLAEAGFRYDFNFAQVGASVRRNDKKTSFIEYARGSIINDHKTRFTGTDNRPNVGKGGISVIAFLDLNANGKKDPGEPKASGLKLYSNSGRTEKSDRDTTVRILGLEPYTNCFIDLDPNSFDNISWRLLKRTYNVAVDPNILKLVEVPVTIAGEANGNVYLDSDGEKKGQGRIVVNFYNSSNKQVSKAITEEDGYFSYFGLIPGNYSARIDTAQMKRLEMTSEPESLTFKIDGGIDGDIVDGLNFTLKLKPVTRTDTTPEIKNKPVVRKDTTYTVIHEITEELMTISEDCYAIQVGAFKRKSSAESFRKKLQGILPGKDVQVTIEGDYFRVRIFQYKNRPDVDIDIATLKKYGFNEFWVVKLVAKQQQRILVNKSDSLARVREIVTSDINPVFTTDMSIQVGAFHDEAKAIALRSRLSVALDKKVSIVHEDGFYKVRITGFNSLEEMERMIPSLGLLGVKDIWLKPAQKAEQQPVPVVEIPVEKELNGITKARTIPDTAVIVAPRNPEGIISNEKGQVDEPHVALQVAIYHYESQALRAQKKIMSKLNLPVVIVQQWGYYHVIVTGFYSKEETYKYYPELAGIGFPGITLIQNYNGQQK